MRKTVPRSGKPLEGRPVPIHEAKTHLSKLFAAAEAGEEVVIARGDVPVAKLVPLVPPTEPVRKRKAGTLKGRISLGPEFFDPLPDDELALWEGR
jgi:antitoxin (DNA-binding transcriptional repressor) of toxin-antitoxin stability system